MQLHLLLNSQFSSEILTSSTLGNMKMQMTWDARICWCHSLCFKPKIELGCNAEGRMRKKEVYPFPLLQDFLVSGYFWPVPDTGNWPVQLKYLQMTLFLAWIHTPVPSWLSSVKYISSFIGSFLRLRSQGPCCLTDAREGVWRGQSRRWRNGIKLTETEKESKNVVVRSCPLKVQVLCQWLFLFWIDMSDSREAEWEGETKEGRKGARQEGMITSSCDLLSVSVQCSPPLTSPCMVTSQRPWESVSKHKVKHKHL